MTGFVVVQCRTVREVVPTDRIGRVVVHYDSDFADVFDREGDHLGLMRCLDALHLADRTAVIPAGPGWWLVVLRGDPHGGDLSGLVRLPVIGWRVDIDAALVGAIPLTASWENNLAVHEARGGGEPYVVLPPEGDALDSQSLPVARDERSMVARLRDLRRQIAEGHPA